VGNADLEIVERIYGFNWASVGGRRDGLDEMKAIVAPDFESKLSPELGGRVLEGVEGFRAFGDALEQDFAEFSYAPERFEDAGHGRVVVIGTLSGVGRASKVPLTGEFGHVWEIADGKVCRVEAHSNSAAALSAAGIAS
jgi:uncharacterized protein